MKVGINYAWKNYAWDFGAAPKKNTGQLWGAPAAWRDGIDRDLAEFTSLGFCAVRWFLLGDGTTFGIDGQKPVLDPQQGWTVAEVPSLVSGFIEDFSFLLERCAIAGIQLLPSLVDFHWAFPGLPVPGSDGVVKSGRHELLCDPEKRETFLQSALVPLLEASADFPDVIYAWEVINEPEWCTQAPEQPLTALDPRKPVGRDAMRAFITRAASLINEAGFRSTVGFAHHASLRQWDSPGMGLTLHQFHYYAEPDRVPAHDFDPRWPVIVGEIATAAHRPWPELGPQQDIASRLQHLAQKGYPATFLWSANREEEHSANPPAVDYSPENRARIRRLLRGA